MAGGLLVSFLFLVIMGALSGCGEDSKEEPYRECVKDEDCGAGFKCEYQECKRIIVDDGDDAPPADGDAEPDADPDPDPDLPDGDGEADGDGDAEPDTETDAENGDTEEADIDRVYDCVNGEYDPRCSTLFQNTCRDNTVDHSVDICKGSQLYECLLSLDCAYPTCGYFIEERYRRTCAEGCVANPDPQQDDYCEEMPPADGDEEAEFEIDTDLDGEGADREPDQINLTDGSPCVNDNGCLPGHRCLLDFDDEGRYCAPDIQHCVYHVGIADGEPAVLYDHGDKICNTEGTGFRRCSSGGWYWQEDFDCPPDQCVSGYLAWPGQTCENYTGCVPMPRPAASACPGNFSCFDEFNCRGDCTLASHCRPGYICVDSLCILNERR